MYNNLTQIAIEGCLHGKLELIYEELANLQKNSGITIDALIICGDFQAIRDQADLQYMHCPLKYKQLGSFHKYYTGQIPTPYLTILIGGNHEASNYMRDLYFGGWLAPKIYYLGQAGSIYLTKGTQKIRITGISGIYNDHDFKYGIKTENIPLTGSSLISNYHVKQIEIFRMELLARIAIMKIQQPNSYGDDSHPFDIILSHDWPQNIALYGDTKQLLEIKKGFKTDVDNGKLGSPPSTKILSLAQPNYWFAGHLHVKFAALYPHPANKYTHFLALGKYVNNQQCLQVLHFQFHKNNSLQPNISQLETKLTLDHVWLAVLKLTIPLQLENKSLYTVDKNGLQVKLLDSNLMNSLIKKYSEMKTEPFDNCPYFQSDMIKWKQNHQKGTQIHQTSYLLKDILQLDPKLFQGTIFPQQKPNTNSQNDKKYQLQKNDLYHNKDQIQLDL